MANGVGGIPNLLQGVDFSHENSGGASINDIMVTVTSSEPKPWWNELYGSLDNASKKGFITSAKNTTINGQKAFEVVGNMYGVMGGRWVIIQANGYYYMMSLTAPVDIYSTQTNTFDDVVNSWVIGNISQ